MAEYKATLAVTNGASSKVITHNLNNVNAVLTGCVCGGWPGRPYISARDANTVTVTFANDAPPGGSPTLDVRVST